MGRNAADQIKKDGALGYLARSAVAPAVFVTGAVESLCRGDLEMPIAGRMSDGAAKAGQTVERKVVDYVKENPVATGMAVMSTVATRMALNSMNERIDRVEQNQSRDNQSRDRASNR